MTGVAIVELGRSAWSIDSFLLSCRVLGRGIEDALLAHITAQARRAGAETVLGTLIPSAKNAPARTFYPDTAFGPARAVTQLAPCSSCH